ncbi:MAG: anthranilate synthase component I family protein [Glycocaulis sp.]
MRELGWQAPEDLLARIAHLPMSLALLGGGEGERGRYSYLTAFPSRVIDAPGSDDPLAPVRAALSAGREGHLGGLFGYELSRRFERLPHTDRTLTGWPELALGWYEAVAVFDHHARTLRVEGPPGAAERLLSALEAPEPLTLPTTLERALEPVWSPQRYIAAATRARDYVRAGDVFQVNLSHRFTARLGGADAPLAVFRRLAKASPAPFAAWLRLDADRVVISNSPERFVSVSETGAVDSRPVKGTRPRGATPQEDARLAAELAASAKDRAENLMIVDLMRNDLSRVCVSGSVKVPELFRVESYANVHHLVSAVTGQLAPGRTIADLIAAGFPPGSITGAPKVRAMEIIAELEGEARGPYCGAMGWIGAGGKADLNVMIRTAGFVTDGAGWRVEARSGGAITSDSDPADELAETHAKIAMLRRAVDEAGT